MSWLRWDKWSSLTAVLNGGTVRRRKPNPVSRNRRLRLDPLEERALLTVVPGHAADQLINDPIVYDLDAMQYGTETYTDPDTGEDLPLFILDRGDPMTLSGQSVASDNDGNFVATWTQFDTIQELSILADGSVGRSFLTNEPIYTTYATGDANIYARYFTDEVQRITLPTEVLEGIAPDSDTFPTFDLKYGGNEVQRLRITAANEPFTSFQNDIEGEFTLGFDADGDGDIDPATETVTVAFDEMALSANVRAIQAGLRSIANGDPTHPLYEVKVEGINPHTYNIRFGDASGGAAQPHLVVTETDFTSGFFSDAFLPAVQVEKIREPMVIGGIPIFSEDPYETATAIESWFAYYATGTFPIGPINFPPPAAVPPLGPYMSPRSMTTPVPRVSVTPVFGLGDGRELVTFDITFTGESGKMDHPELAVSAVQGYDGAGNPVDLSHLAEQAVTLKESSSVFRVNPDEPDLAFTPGSDKFDQTAPAVAMDADGDFAITWQSEVPSWENFGSVTDIFARQFSPIGANVDPGLVEGFYTPGVRALATVEPYDDPASDPFTFRVNNFTTESQTSPDIAMDADGNFVIGWATSGQDISFFNGIWAQRFNRDGERLGTEWRVNFEDTEIHTNPFVGMSHDGYFFVTWTLMGSIQGELYGAEGQILADQFTIAGGDNSTSAFDRKGNFVVGWESGRDTDNIGITSMGAFARQYAMEFNLDGELDSLNDIRTVFRANSASFNPDSAPLWPLAQSGHQVALDADGDMVITYDGFGPDVSYNSSVASMWYSEVMARPENEDLLPFFPAGGLPDGFYNSGDVTGIIEEVLFGATSVPESAWYTATGTAELQQFRIPYYAGSTWDASAGRFRVRVGGFGGEWTGTIEFDPDNLAQVAADLQSAIVALSDDYQGTVVTIASATEPYEFQIDFTGAAVPPTSLLSRTRVVPTATDEQLGRLNAILDSVATLMRGEANGVMYSRWDADPEAGTLNILDSDSVVNAMRDGHNQRHIIALERNDEYIWDSFRLRLYHPARAGYEEVRVNVVRYDDGTVNMLDTAGAIAAALRGLERTGVNWPWNFFEGPVDVRPVYDAELGERYQTPWDLTDASWEPIQYMGAGDEFTDYVFEVTFQGEVHDTPMMLYAMDGGVIRDEFQTLTFNPTGGGQALSGWVTLSQGNETTNPIFIDYDPALYPPGEPGEPDAGLQIVANQIQSALVGQLDLEGVQVEALPGGPPYRFQIHFAGDSGGTNQAPVEGTPHVEDGDDPPPPLNATISSSTQRNGGLDLAVGNAPNLFVHTYGLPGTPQYAASIGMTPEGDFVVGWTQEDLYTDGFTAGTSVYFRTFNETTDTAGPSVTDLYDPDGNRVNGEEAILAANGLSHMVVAFDEELLSADPAELEWALQERDRLLDEGAAFPEQVKRILDSAINPENYQLLRNGLEIEGAVVKVEFGMNKAADLAGRIDPLTGEYYDVSPIATNKWQAVLTFDSSRLAAGVQPLPGGLYELVMLRPELGSGDDPGRSGLRDKSGNPLGYTGFTADQFGQDFTRSFFVALDVVEEDDPIGDPPSPIDYGGGVTHPESRAVAVDGDGDHVVAWTQQIDDVDRVVVQLYNADGSPAATAPTLIGVTDGEAEYDGLEQRYASVAVTPDGDFVVTWTQFDPVADPAPDGPTHEANVYARQFSAAGEALGESFRVNTYTSNDQQWSDVAMDVEGNFIVTWSSLGQEDNGQLGTGWGVYARRYDAFGRSLSPEFRVNVTTAGNQQLSKVDMAADGGFVIAWQSDQNGVSTDIIARSFWPNGSAQEGPLGGEIQVNQTTEGDQRFPNVAINLAGDQFVVTWSSYGQDGSGWGVFGRQFTRTISRDEEMVVHYPSTDVPRAIPDNGVVRSFLEINDTAFIRDLNVRLNIVHPRTRDLVVHLISPAGTRVLLFDQVPEGENGANFDGTILDDDGAISIDDFDGGAAPPFTGRFAPQELLARFNGENAYGTWMLEVRDVRRDDPPQPRQEIVRWSLEITRDPAALPEFQVNTSTPGNQMYSSVDMDYQGNFIISWSGAGNQTGEQDSAGVFYQRYDAGAQRIGTESRANFQLAGNQRSPSIGSDSTANVVIVWTGPDATNTVTNVFRFVSINELPLLDVSGPIVTGVLGPDGSRLLSGDAFEVSGDGLEQLTVVFNEEMNTFVDKDGIPVMSSIENTANWSLLRNGSQIIEGISDITFAFNSATRKYEAVVTFDGNGTSAGVAPLAPGNYSLVVNDLVTDGANALDGNFDGTPGTYPGDSGYTGYRFDFVVADGPRYGAEFRVNEDTQYEQVFSQTEGTGFAREQTRRSLAADHDGNFVVVWTSYGQDDPNDPQGAGVYMRLFDRNDTPLTGDVLVNQTTAGHQHNASVAMSASGDFVVVWESEGQDSDGSRAVFARMYNAAGQAISGEFRVPTDTANDQFNPAAAMDVYGNFVVVWATGGQSFSYFNDIKGQVFDYTGQRVGGEFRVNQEDIPGTSIGAGSNEVNPSVAMAPDGSFVVAWDQNVVQTNGVVTDTQIVARMFDRFGTPQLNANTGDTNEFRVNVGDDSFLADVQHEPKESATTPGGSDTLRTARNSQVAMDLDGNFMVAWEAYQDNDVNAVAGPDSYGIYFRRFHADGTPDMESDHQANLTITNRDDDAQQPTAQYNTDKFAYDQVNASLAMDADGDYVIVWDGNGATPHPLEPMNPLLVSDLDDQGIFLRRFHAQDSQNTAEQVSVQSRVNATQPGYQKFPSVIMTPKGDIIVVWSGAGVGDQNGIFARRYREASDTAGPLATELWIGDTRIAEGSQVRGTVHSMRVVFTEAMTATGPGSATWPASVLNPDNYQIVRDGVTLYDVILSIDFQLNPATNKWEAVLTLDGNGAAPGTVALLPGDYEVVVRNTVRDAVGNPLGRTGVNPDGEPFRMAFNLVDAALPDVPVGSLVVGGQIFRPESGSQNTPRSVAGDADGEHVVVWIDTEAGQEGVWARVYNQLRWEDVDGQRVSVGPVAGTAIRVTGNATAMFASVARDGDGDFVVTWSQNDGGTSSWNVWARRYDALGNALGAAFMVNTYTNSAQLYSSAAMSTGGDFVITWQSLGQEGSGYDVYAQRFGPGGERLGGVSEIQVLELVGNPEGTFTLTWNVDNDPNTPAVTTGPITATPNTALLAERIQAALNAVAGSGNAVDVRMLDLRRVGIFFVDEGAARDQDQLLVTNQNFTRPADGITTATLVEGNSGELRVNDTTAGNQTWASIAMDAGGNFVVTWTGDTTAGDSDIYAKRFVSNDAFRLGSDMPGQEGRITERDRDIRWATTTDDPDNHIVPPGAGYDGVVRTDNGGSGILLWTGRHILTAAHVVDAGGGTPVGMIGVEFDLPGGLTTIQATEIYIHPGWTGDILDANDLAIIVLPYEAPPQAERYNIYRGTNPLNQVIDFVGYGTQGQGAEDTYDGLKRRESNVFEYYGEQLNGLPVADFGMGMGTFDIPEGAVLIYDFDSGLPENDVFGLLFGRNDLGLGQEEGSASHGDSGGPVFLNGLVAGVTSGGFEYTNADSDAIPFNVSFGTIGMYSNTAYYADWIDALAQFTSAEFVVNDTLEGIQKWSDVAMDADGNFVVTWTSMDQDGDAEGVFAKRYNADGTEVLNPDGEPIIDPDTGEPVVDPVTGEPVIAPLGEFQVNTFTPGKQQHSKVAMDADGDFTIVWESVQDQSGGSVASFGIYAQRYVANSKLGSSTHLGLQGQMGGELAVNQYKPGDQRFPSIVLDDTGDAVIVWSGAGESDPQGIFLQRSYKTDDDAGPTVTDVHAVPASGARERVFQDGTIRQPVTQLVVTFGENLQVGSAAVYSAVTNPANWELTRDGEIVQNAIVSVQFGLNAATNKYEAVVTLDGNPNLAGAQPLESGQYQLSIQDRVEDLFGNRLDGNYDGIPGGRFQRTFVIPDASVSVIDGPGAPGADPGAPGDTPGTPGALPGDELVNYEESLDQTTPQVATDAQGNYVVVWVSEKAVPEPDPDDPDAPPVDPTEVDSGNIMAQRYNRFGVKLGGEFIVNSFRTGPQSEPVVAMDQYGNFVVVWSGVGEDDTHGVFARVFSSTGQPLAEQFRVNQEVQYAQDQPAVAMDQYGNFAVAWSSYGQDRRTSNTTTSVFVRRFNIQGNPLGNELLVNTYEYGSQRNPHLAMAPDGRFVVVWQDDTQDGNQWGVYGQRFNAAGAKQGGEFRVNTRTAERQEDPRVAMDAAGNFIVVFADHGADISNFGVYARRYNAAGTALDAAEFRVNQHTLNNQYQPSVGVDQAGNFVIVWSTYGQDRDDGNRDFGVFARMYNADRSDWINPATGTAMGEFRVNATVAGDQALPDVAVAPNGNFVVVWAGPDADGTGIYHRPIGVTTSSTGDPGDPGDPGPGTAASGFDLVGWVSNPSGDWWVGESNGLDAFDNARWGRWSANVAWTDVTVADVTGDGLDDIIGRVESNGDWWVAVNDGNGGFMNERWGRWSANVDWLDVMVGDFTGDGRADIVGRVKTSGDWWVAKSTGAGFTNERWGKWSPNVTWLDVSAGDFTGEGRLDIVGRVKTSGDWWVAKSTGTGFVNERWSRWSPNVAWTDVMLADFNGDGRADLIGRVETSGDWWVAKSNGTGFANERWGRWSANVAWTNVAVGDFTGDGRADLVGRVDTNGDWWVAKSNGSNGFTNEQWTRWNASAGWKHVMVGNFSAAALHAESAPPADRPATESITTADLQPIVEEAILRLPAELEGIAFEVVIADLPGLKLGQTSGNTIWLDDDAAGFGWFVDPTPADNAQFEPSGTTGVLTAHPGSDAAIRMDLLTVVMHELSHLMGRGHAHEGLMQTTLESGTRWLDDLATGRRDATNRELQVQAIDEVLQFDWR